MTPVREIDCRGMRCPLPIIRISHELNTISIGEELILLSDDPATVPDLAAWARMRQQFAEQLAEHRFLVRRLS
jgi:tRNA 2-thiouridine synthesizing protein A